MKIKKLSLLIIMIFVMFSITMIKPKIIVNAVESTDVAKIGEEGYATLEEAIEVANNSDTPTTITLLSDFGSLKLSTLSFIAINLTLYKGKICSR